MPTLKDISVNVFMALAKDANLQLLLEMPSTTMKDIREQILEDRYPNDLIQNNLPRVCVYENPSTPAFGQMLEKSWLEVDIYVTKEMDKVDRKTLLIAEHIINALDTKERQKRGLKPIVAGMGLNFYNRLPNLPTDRPEWKKYGLLFYYDNIRV